MQNIKIKVKEWFTAVGAALLKGVLLLVVLNLILYVVMLARRPAVPKTPQTFDRETLLKAYPGWREEDVRTLLRETWRDGQYQYEPFTEFRERPFRGRFVHVDPAGFRFPKDHAPWPPRPQTINVFVFGGSTTHGVGLPDDETIPSRLQEYATSDHSTPPLAIYNFGQPAYFSSQELILFEQLLVAGFVPQVALFIDGMNDFIFVDGKPLFYGRFKNLMDGKPEGMTLADLPMIQAAHKLSARWSKQQPQSPQKVPHYDDPALLQGAVDRWLANKRLIEAIAKAFGVRTFFVWQPAPFYKYDLRYHFKFHSSKEFWLPEQRIGYGYPLMESLRAQGKLGANVLWLADMQQDKSENFYVDGVHYNAAFSKEIAGQIYSFLREHLNQAENVDERKKLTLPKDSFTRIVIKK